MREITAACGADTTERARHKRERRCSQNIWSLQQKQRAQHYSTHAVHLSEAQRATLLFGGRNHFALLITAVLVALRCDERAISHLQHIPVVRGYPGKNDDDDNAT